MALGSVKWFNASKGYGFIQPDDSSHDVFVHISAVQASGIDGLEQGQRIEFELHQLGNGRTNAQDIRLLGDAPESRAAMESRQETEELPSDS